MRWLHLFFVIPGHLVEVLLMLNYGFLIFFQSIYKVNDLHIKLPSPRMFVLHIVLGRTLPLLLVNRHFIPGVNNVFARRNILHSKLLLQRPDVKERKNGFITFDVRPLFKQFNCLLISPVFLNHRVFFTHVIPQIIHPISYRPLPRFLLIWPVGIRGEGAFFSIVESHHYVVFFLVELVVIPNRGFHLVFLVFLGIITYFCLVFYLLIMSLLAVAHTIIRNPNPYFLVFVLQIVVL